MAKRPREQTFYGLLESRPDSYIYIKAMSEQQALENAQRQYPDCDRVVTEKQFDEKKYTNELLRIRAENQSELDDF